MVMPRCVLRTRCVLRIKYESRAAVHFLTAFTEIVGCYLSALWLKQHASPWLLVPSVISLSLFVWLLALHDAASGRVYAAYGGVYIIGVALLWLWDVDGIRPNLWDSAGGVALAGMGIIICPSR